MWPTTCSTKNGSISPDWKNATTSISASKAPRTLCRTKETWNSPPGRALRKRKLPAHFSKYNHSDPLLFVIPLWGGALCRVAGDRQGDLMVTNESVWQVKRSQALLRRLVKEPARPALYPRFVLGSTPLVPKLCLGTHLGGKKRSFPVTYVPKQSLGTRSGVEPGHDGGTEFGACGLTDFLQRPSKEMWVKGRARPGAILRLHPFLFP